MEKVWKKKNKNKCWDILQKILVCVMVEVLNIDFIFYFYLMLIFFVGNASEFLPGPIYDLNQIKQVVAGM